MKGKIRSVRPQKSAKIRETKKTLPTPPEPRPLPRHRIYLERIGKRPKNTNNRKQNDDLPPEATSGERAVRDMKEETVVSRDRSKEVPRGSAAGRRRGRPGAGGRYRQMNTRSKGRRKDAFRRCGMLVLGPAILAFGLYNIHRQSGITEGGVLGLMLLLNHWLEVTPAVLIPALDVVCYLVGFRFLGGDFARRSLVATLSFAFWYSLLERFPPLIPSLWEHPVAAALLGSCFVGVGVGLAVRAGGAAGGDDALAMSISHVLGWSISRSYLFTDLLVLALSLTYLPPENLACSLLTVTLSSFLIGRMQMIGRPRSPVAGETRPRAMEINS